MKRNKRSNTCIAVIKTKKGRLLMAGDRRVSWSDGHFQKTVYPKVVKKNGVLIGGSGLSTLCTLICNVMPIPAVPQDKTAFDYITSLFLEEVLAKLSHLGYVIAEGEMKFPEFFDALFLIGIRDELFELEISPEVGVSIDAVDIPHAIGCGSDLALGSLKTTEKIKTNGKNKISDEERLKLALKIASEFNTGCDDHIDIIEGD